MVVVSDAVLHARLKAGTQHAQLTGLGNGKELAVSQRDVPEAVLGVVGQLLIVLFFLVVPVVDGVEHGGQCRAGGDVGDGAAAHDLLALGLAGGVLGGDPAPELVKALDAGVEKGNDLVHFSGNVATPAEVDRDIHGLIKGLLGLHTRLPHQLIGGVTGSQLHGVADEGDPVQGIGADLPVRQSFPGLLGKIPVGGVGAGLAAAHGQKFLVHGVGVVPLGLVHIGAAQSGEDLRRVLGLGIGEHSHHIPWEVGEQGPHHVVARDVAGHKPAHHGVSVQNALHVLLAHVGQGGQQQGIVDLPELLIAALHDGDHVPVCLAPAVLVQNIVQVGHDLVRRIQTVSVHPAVPKLLVKIFLHPGHVETALDQRNGYLLQEDGVVSNGGGLIGDGAHDVVAHAGVYHLHQVIHNVIHGMHNIKAAAVGPLDGAVLVGKAPSGSDAPLVRAYGSVQRHIEFPALMPFLCGHSGDKPGIHAPGLKELLLENIQTFGNFLELRVLGLQLSRPALHKGGGVLPVICKDAHTLRKALRPMLHRQILTKQAIFLLIVQVQPMQGSFQPRSNILAAGVRQVANDDLAGHGVAVGRVGGQFVCVCPGRPVKFPDALIAVQPCLGQYAGLCPQLFRHRPGVCRPFFPQSDRAGGRVRIQGIIGIDFIGQLLDQSQVFAREDAKEIVGEQRIVDGGRLTVLEELAHVLRNCLAQLFLFAVGGAKLRIQVVQKLLLHLLGKPSGKAVGGVQMVSQLMGDGGQVLGDLRSDALRVPVILAPDAHAPDVAVGDVQTEVLPDLLQ